MKSLWILLLTAVFCIWNVESDNHGHKTVIYVTPPNYAANPDKQENDIAEIELLPREIFEKRNTVKRASLVDHRRNRSPDEPPSTSYGTPYENHYSEPSAGQSPPSTSYGVPFKNVPQATTTTQSPEPETTEPEASEGPARGYNYLPPEETENVIINRNIYFYKPTSDFEETPKIQQIKLPPPRKNYNVIFVKAPTIVSPPQVIPIAPRTEDKTLVYVLVKKPEDQPDVVIPTSPPPKASPPEVYYVKYDTRKGNEKGYHYKNAGSSVGEKSEEKSGSSEEKGGSSEEKDDSKESDSKSKRKRSQKRSDSVRKGRSSLIVDFFGPLIQRSRAYEG